METLKKSIIENLDHLPEPTLREAMEYVTFLSWREEGNERSILTAGGELSGSPIPAEEIEHLYGHPASS